MKPWRAYQYYAIIGVISVIALLFLPMIGSEAGLNWEIPNTAVGWIVYVVSKLIVAVINILIFHCFVMQGKSNVQNNPKYTEAREILALRTRSHEYDPKSPLEWERGVYGKKGLTVFVTSILSSVGLTQAVLTFDWIAMLTYFFTIVMGIVFGILQMNDTEDYYTNEFWQYAKRVEKEQKDAGDQRQAIQESGRAGSEE